MDWHPILIKIPELPATSIYYLDFVGNFKFYLKWVNFKFCVSCESRNTSSSYELSQCYEKYERFSLPVADLSDLDVNACRKMCLIENFIMKFLWEKLYNYNKQKCFTCNLCCCCCFFHLQRAKFLQSWLNVKVIFWSWFFLYIMRRDIILIISVGKLNFVSPYLLRDTATDSTTCIKINLIFGLPTVRFTNTHYTYT